LAACWDAGAKRTQVRLDCGAPGECLPFLVYLHDVYFEAGASSEDGTYPSAKAESCRPVSGLPPLPPIPKTMVRPGDRARAVFLAHGLRMTASVTCLERGREGEVIRVRALDGHIFRARISGPALLEAMPQ
jgi:hypothetical protein